MNGHRLYVDHGISHKSIRPLRVIQCDPYVREYDATREALPPTRQPKPLSLPLPAPLGARHNPADEPEDFYIPIGTRKKCLADYPLALEYRHDLSPTESSRTSRAHSIIYFSTLVGPLLLSISFVSPISSLDGNCVPLLLPFCRRRRVPPHCVPPRGAMVPRATLTHAHPPLGDQRHYLRFTPHAARSLRQTPRSTRCTDHRLLLVGDPEGGPRIRAAAGSGGRGGRGGVEKRDER